jgi:hypothetical protein
MAPRAKKAKGDFSHLQALAQQETAPLPITTKDIERLLIPASYKQYQYTERLWRE